MADFLNTEDTESAEKKGHAILANTLATCKCLVEIEAKASERLRQ
jgi:hypothetical protein